MRRLIALLAVLMALAPASSARAVQPGVVGTAMDSPAGEAFASAGLLSTAPAGLRWVRVMLPWPLLQPDGPAFGPAMRSIDARIQSLHDAGLNVLVMVTGAPRWAHPSRAGDDVPPDQPGTYALMMAALAKRYAGQVQALEVWNEPDDDPRPGEFWRGPPDPAGYTRLLKATYAAVKATGPQAPQVVVGGLTGNDRDFLEGMYRAGAKGSFDALGVHLDSACRQSGPDDVYRENGRVGRWAFTGYRELYAIMLSHFDAKPIWITELGWSASPELCDQGPTKGRGPGGVSEARQAQLLTRSYDCLAHDFYVGPAFWWSLRDYGPDPKRISQTYGLIAWNGRLRPAYTAFQDVWRRGPSGAFCGAKADWDKPTAVLRAPPLYSRRFVAVAAAVDSSTPIRRMELWNGFQLVKTVRGTNVTALPWPGASRLAYGDHLLQVRAYDAAGNVGGAYALVRRADPNGPRTVTASVGFKATPDEFGAVRVDATVRPPADWSYLEPPRGDLVLRLKRRGGRRMVIREDLGRGSVYRLTPQLRKGTWTVRGVLDVEAPYRRTRTPVSTFRVR